MILTNKMTTMKITDKILTNLCLSTLLLFSLFSVFSCSDDDDDVRIYSVWSNMLAEEARQITSVYTGFGWTVVALVVCKLFIATVCR